MPFGRKAQEGAIRVYEYGCRQPTAGLPAMLDQLAKRNAYWNRLVEIEHEFRAGTAVELTVPDSAAPALEARLAVLRQEIKARRQAARSGHIDMLVLKAGVAIVLPALKAARAADKVARKLLVAERKAELAELEGKRHAAVLTARSASGLYWGNYDDVEHHYDVARKEAMKKGEELRFHRFVGEGKVTVRFQDGLPAAAVFAWDTRLQIDPVPERAWTAETRRGERRRLARTTVRLRVGSNDDRSPLWLELPMVMHRPPPPGSVIRGASVCRERVADVWRYKLIVVVVTAPAAATERSGVLSIDIGWRNLTSVMGSRFIRFAFPGDKSGRKYREEIPDPTIHPLRVAYWRDDAGREGEVRLPADKIGQFGKVNDIKSIRDRNLNGAKAALVATLEWLPPPLWLRERTAHLAQWRSTARLAVLVRDWRERRFDGDERLFGCLELWLARDEHLWQYERHLDDQLRRWRREEYRKFACQMARQYAKIVVEDFDLRDVAEKPLPEDGPATVTKADWQRTVAATSTLRLALQNACQREGVVYEEREGAYTTQECNACGKRAKFDAARELVHECPHCGAEYDQDANAAAVLLEGREAVASQK